MAFTNTPFVDGNAITEADLKDRIDNFETWLNGGAAAGDVSHGEWVSKNHILRPEFTGGSDNRAEFCTGTTRYRVHGPDSVGAEVFHAEARGGGSGPDDDVWEPVNGLNVTVKVYRPMNIMYSASWWAWESGNDTEFVNSSGVTKYDRLNRSNRKVAEFCLFSQKIDNTSLVQYDATRRSLFAGSSAAYDKVNSNYNIWQTSDSQQMSTHYVLSLTAGIYNIGIRIYAQEPGTYDGHYSQNIFIRSRSCVVDGHFNGAT